MWPGAAICPLRNAATCICGATTASFDSFQFHITLTDGIADAGLRALVAAGLRKALEGVLDAPLRIEICPDPFQTGKPQPALFRRGAASVRQRTDCTGNSMMSLTVRQERMRLLALASVERLEAGLSAITPPDYEVVRGPETGLVMIRGRVGNTGDTWIWAKRLRRAAWSR